MSKGGGGDTTTTINIPPELEEFYINTANRMADLQTALPMAGPSAWFENIGRDILTGPRAGLQPWQSGNLQTWPEGDRHWKDPLHPAAPAPAAPTNRAKPRNVPAAKPASS